MKHDDVSTELADPGSRVRGPHGRGAAGRLATLLRDPLAGYLGMYAAYGDTIRVPISPKSCFFVLTRPEYAEHVLALNQDNYVKAFTYRPLRALMGNGLLTSEGEQRRRPRCRCGGERPRAVCRGPGAVQHRPDRRCGAARPGHEHGPEARGAGNVR